MTERKNEEKAVTKQPPTKPKTLHPRLIEFFSQLGMTSGAQKKTIVYSKQSTPTSKMDVGRFIRDQKYWAKPSTTTTPKPKKIILNYWQLLNECESEDGFQHLLLFLRDQGFEMCIWHDNKIKDVFDQITKGRQIQIELKSNDDLKKELVLAGHDVDELYLLDHQELEKLVSATNYYQITNINEELFVKNKEIVVTNKNADAILNAFNSSLKKQFDTIQYCVITAGHSYEFVWKNDFTHDELTKLLMDLKNGNLEVLLSASSIRNLIQFHDISLFSKTQIDVSFFENLTSLRLENFSEIKGLNNLKKLENLSVKRVGNLDVSALENLKNLSTRNMEGEVRLNENLESITMDGVLDIDNSRLSRLKKLMLDGKYRDQKAIDTMLSEGDPNLEQLTLNSISSAIELDLEKFPKLKKLSLLGCNFKAVKSTRACENLEELEINGDNAADNIPMLIAMPTAQLRSLLCNVPKLRELRLNFIKDLDSIDLSGLIFLQDLSVTRVPHLRELIGFENHPSIIKVNLVGFVREGAKKEGIQKLNFKGAKQLKAVKVDQCTRLCSIEGLEECPSLLLLDLGDSACVLVNASGITIVKKNDFDNKGVFYLNTEIYSRSINNVQSDTKSLHSSSIGGLIKPTSIPIPKQRYRVKLPIYPDEILSADADIKEGVPSKRPFNPKTSVSTEEYKLTKIFSPQSKLDSEPDASNYRKLISNVIEVDERQNIELINALAKDFKSYQVPEKKLPDERGIYIAAMPGPFFAGKEYILYGLSTKDQLLALENKEMLEVSYSETQSQYKVKVKTDSQRSLLSIKYTIKAEPNYFITSAIRAEDIFKKSSVQPLPETLKLQIKACLDLTYSQTTAVKPSNEFLEFLTELQKSKQPHEILNAIIIFCKKFKCEDLSSITNNGVYDFLNTMWEAKGLCDHRTKAFMALCQYFGFAVRDNENDIHEFPELYLNTEKGPMWKGIDLGGGQVKRSYVESPLIKPSVNNRHTHDDNKAELYHKDFLPDSKWLEECKTISDVVNGLDKLPKAPLIRLADAKDAYLTHAVFYEYLKKPVVYIDNVEELTAAFTIHQVKNNSIDVIDGPLKEMILKGNGSIVINWSNFSANEKAIYKSMIDDPPTLNGLPIPIGVNVIGMLDENADVNDVFLSRSEEVRIPKKISIVAPASKPWYIKNDEKIQSVNLYHDNDWMEILVEAIKLDQDALLSKEGPLVHCMRNGLPLIIKNPPWKNPDFKLFWHKLITENYILINGEYVVPKEGFKVIFKEQPNAAINFTLDAKPQENGRKIYISDENFNQLFSTQHITAQGKVISSAPGYLKEYKEGDQFIIRHPLTNDQIQKITDSIQLIKNADAKMPQVHFCVQAIPEKPTAFTGDYKNASYHIVSNDPDTCIKVIDKDVKPENIFHTTLDNNWADFFEDIKLVKNNNKILAERKEQSLLKKLKAGETVILSGDLTSDEYASIKTLFMEPPYIYINGIREDNIKGKIQWISKPQLAYNTNEISTILINTNWCMYKQALEADQKNINKNILENVDKFLYSLMRLNFNNHTPDLSKITFNKYKLLCKYAESKSTQENPIKPIFQYYYKKGTPEYAYINVLAKYYLSSSNDNYVRKEKLLKIIDPFSYEHFKTVFWQALNCYSAKALRDTLQVAGMTLDNAFPLPSEQEILRVWFKIFSIQADASYNKAIKPIGLDRFTKQQARLASSLRDKSKRLLFLLGPAGTGKTFTAKRVVKKENLFVGEGRIQEWIDAKSDQAILLLDEANLEAAGKWEFLRGLTNNPPTITYKNKTTVLGPQHKVIVTGNPHDYPGRHLHSIFWEKAHVIWFAPFQPHFIKQKVIEFMQVPATVGNQKIATIIADAYTFLCEHPHRIAEITMRDIENICARFLSTNYPIGRVILDEMSGVLSTDEDRQELKAFLEKLTGTIHEHKLEVKPKDIYILDDFQSAWVMLQDDLKMREERVKARSNVLPGRSSSNKLGVLLEGASGVGKSTLLEAALKQFGFALNANDTQKKYYKITVGSLHVEEILLKAFHEGSVVILDELNLKTEVEILLNQLLSGTDPASNTAKKAGFMVLASQNPPHYAGTKRLSTALGSRFHNIHMKNLTAQSIEKYAEAAGHPHPKAVPVAYHEMQMKHHFVNARHMFHAVKKYQKPDVKYDQVKDFKKKH